VFSASLTVPKGSDYAAGVIKLRDNAAILKSVVGHSAAWMTSLAADVIDVSDRNAIFFICVAPAGSKAPSSHREFFSVPGRALTALTKETAHGVVRPRLPSVLSYKIAGCALEEAPQAILVLGVLLSKKVAEPEVFHFGVQARLRSSGSGFQEGTEETAEQNKAD